jgi:hypothetical protein
VDQAFGPGGTGIWIPVEQAFLPVPSDRNAKPPS